MTNTPETDEFFMRANIDWDMEVQFARKLERERDDLIVSLNFHADLNKELIRQRDEAREETKRTREFMDHGFATAKKELDNAIEMGNRTRDNSGAIIASQVVENIILTQQRDRLAEALEYILGIGLTQKTKAKAEKALQND